MFTIMFSLFGFMFAVVVIIMIFSAVSKVLRASGGLTKDIFTKAREEYDKKMQELNKKYKEDKSDEETNDENIVIERPETYYCDYCGAEIGKSDKKCSSCGARLNRK